MGDTSAGDLPKTFLLALLSLRLLRSQKLFGAIWFGAAIVSLNVDHLREIAEECIKDEGFTPA